MGQSGEWQNRYWGVGGKPFLCLARGLLEGAGRGDRDVVTTTRYAIALFLCLFFRRKGQSPGSILLKPTSLTSTRTPAVAGFPLPQTQPSFAPLQAS
jgi:hypothetical protein